MSNPPPDGPGIPETAHWGRSQFPRPAMQEIGRTIKDTVADEHKRQRRTAAAECERLRKQVDAARALVTSRHAPTCVGLGIKQRWAALYDALGEADDERKPRDPGAERDEIQHRVWDERE